MNIEMFSQMGGAFLGPYKDAISAIDLDNISLYGVSPILKVHAKLNLFIRGISHFVGEILKNC